jgi:hypothetical protein
MELWRRVRLVGPLFPYVAGFADRLSKLGYSERTVDETVRAVSHISAWMSGRALEVGKADARVGGEVPARAAPERAPSSLAGGVRAAAGPRANSGCDTNWG